DVARDVQVVVVGADLIARHDSCEVLDVAARMGSINDALDVSGAQEVVLAVFNKALGCVNKQHVIVAALFLEHHDDGRNASAVEDRTWQANDGIDVVGLDKACADRLFRPTTEKYAVWQNNRHNAVWLDVEQLMEQEGEICLVLWCQTKLR